MEGNTKNKGKKHARFYDHVRFPIPARKKKNGRGLFLVSLVVKKLDKFGLPLGEYNMPPVAPESAVVIVAYIVFSRNKKQHQKVQTVQPTVCSTSIIVS